MLRLEAGRNPHDPELLETFAAEYAYAAADARLKARSA